MDYIENTYASAKAMCEEMSGIASQILTKSLGVAPP